MPTCDLTVGKNWSMLACFEGSGGLFIGGWNLEGRTGDMADEDESDDVDEDEVEDADEVEDEDED